MRSLLIGLVLVVHGTMALPWPDINQRDLAYGVAQEELARWAGRLTAVGLPRTREQLAEEVLAVGRASRQVQARIHGPWKPLLRVTGTGQAWGLFAYPDNHAGRLVVSVRRRAVDGLSSWQEVYRAPGEGEPWLVDLLEYRRVRGIYDDNGDRPKPGVFYDRLADWLATELMVRGPDVAEVMLRFDQVHIVPPPAARSTGPEARKHVRRRDRQRVADRLAARGGALEARVGPGATATEPLLPRPVGP